MFFIVKFIFKLILLAFYYVCLFGLQIQSSLGIQIILIFINIFVADPVPYIDEIIQIIIFMGTIKK